MPQHYKTSDSRTFSFSMLNARWNRNILYGLLTVLCVAAFITVRLLMYRAGFTTPGMILALAAVAAVIAAVMLILRTGIGAKQYDMEISPRGIRVWENSKVIFQDDWEMIHQLTLGYNKRGIVLIKFEGRQGFECTAGSLDRPATISILKDIVHELRNRLRLETVKGRRPWYMLESGIYQYGNPLYRTSLHNNHTP